MKPEKQGPMRTVVSMSQMGYRRGSAGWLLDCGHVVLRKLSVPQAKRAHCPECAAQASKVEVEKKCKGCSSFDSIVDCCMKIGKRISTGTIACEDWKKR